MKKKILHYVEASGGGVVSVIRDQVSYLKESCPDDFEFHIYYSVRNGEKDLIAQEFPDCVLHETQINRDLSVKADMLEIQSLARYVRDHSVEVVHAHSSKAGFLARLASWRFPSNVKTYYTPHCYAFLSGEFGVLKRAIYLLAEVLLSRFPRNTIIACGPSEFACARKLGAAVMVTNGVHDIGVSTEKYPTYDYVSVGRLAQQKGYFSYQKLNASLSEKGLSGLWVGGGEASVSFPITGWIARTEVIAHLHSSRLYISTAEWEGLPVAPVEAMSAGLPVVALDAPGVRDVVFDGVNGYLCQTLEEVENKVLHLLENPALYNEMAMNSRNLFTEHFSLENYSSLSGLYRGSNAR